MFSLSWAQLLCVFPKRSGELIVFSYFCLLQLNSLIESNLELMDRYLGQVEQVIAQVEGGENAERAAEAVFFTLQEEREGMNDKLNDQSLKNCRAFYARWALIEASNVTKQGRLSLYECYRCMKKEHVT